MRILVFLLVFMLQANISSGSGVFRINSLFRGEISIRVNGKQYTIDSTFTSIPTAYPLFDTLIFEIRDSNSIILCNFRKDSSYTIYHASCGNPDIIPSWKLDYDSLKIWNIDYDKYSLKIQNHLSDKPSFTLKIKNGTTKDSIYGWYMDYACFPQFKILDEKGWNYGVPVKCFYWNNISRFMFFTSSKNYKKYIYHDGIVEDIYPGFTFESETDKPNIDVLGLITVRLFDDENYVITYDVKTKGITLDYANRKN